VKIEPATVLIILVIVLFPGHAMASDYSKLMGFVFRAGFTFFGVICVVMSCFYLLPGLILNIILLITYLIYSIQFLVVEINDVDVFFLLPLVLNLVGFIVLGVNKLKKSNTEQ
jgi:hypothetical protein